MLPLHHCMAKNRCVLIFHQIGFLRSFNNLYLRGVAVWWCTVTWGAEVAPVTAPPGGDPGLGMHP